jgi:predicted NUDIX family phosphoesterase
MTEQVMVVGREDLDGHIAGREFGMIREKTDEVFSIIESKHFFIDRPVAEESPQYKQIIPYVAIRNDGAWFLLRRLKKQTEARLHEKLSLGIGGHINPDTPTLLGGLQKELEEEVHVADPYELTFVGILNDDTTEVGRVHLGAVYLLDASTRDVTVRETEKMAGEWVAESDLEPLRERMETWSQIVYDQVIRSDED